MIQNLTPFCLLGCVFQARKKQSRCLIAEEFLRSGAFSILKNIRIRTGGAMKSLGCVATLASSEYGIRR